MAMLPNWAEPMITALRRADRSFSHWGMFMAPSERVMIRLTDHGRIGNDYVAEFTCGNERVMSHVSVLACERRSDMRGQADIAVITAAFDLVPGSVEVQ